MITPESHPSGLAPAIAVTAVTLLALVLRFYRIGAWGLESDEVFMIRDSLRLIPTNPRPLMYVLNHYLIIPFVPLNEFTVRLLPAAFGVLTIPVFYAVARRFVGIRAALFGSFFIATNSMYVYYSQFGRYWTLVFLLCSVYPFALYLGARDRDGRMLLLGAVTGVLAVLAHPVSVLLLGALGAWVILEYGRRDRLRSLLSQRRVQAAIGVAALLVALIAFRFVPVLRNWVVMHDEVPQAERGGEFLLYSPRGQVLRQAVLIMIYVQNLSPALVLAGLVGIYLLWSGRTRGLALLLTCLFVLPTAFVLLVQSRTAVSHFYLVPATPVLFIGAGVFLDRVVGLDLGVRPRWLLAAVAAVLIFASDAPTLISQYRDGRRYDFRGAARWLETHAGPNDAIFSDQPKVVGYYLAKREVNRLVADPVRLAEAASRLQQRGTGVLWLVAPAPSHAFRTNPRLGSLNDWIYSHCQLRNTIGTGRIDFRQNFLQIYRCPPLVPVADRRTAGAKAGRGPA